MSPTDWLWTTSSTFSTFFFSIETLERLWATAVKFALSWFLLLPLLLLLLLLFILTFGFLTITPPPFPIPGRTHSHPQYLLGRSSIYHLILSFFFLFLLSFVFFSVLLAFNPTRRIAVDTTAHIFRRQRPTATTTGTLFFYMQPEKGINQISRRAYFNRQKDRKTRQKSPFLKMFLCIFVRFRGMSVPPRLGHAVVAPAAQKKTNVSWMAVAYITTKPFQMSYIYLYRNLG